MSNYSCFLIIMMLNIILQIANPLFKRKSRTGSRSGSGSAIKSVYFLLEAVEAEAFRSEAKAEALEIVALLHHCLKYNPAIPNNAPATIATVSQVFGF
jgi:hypothetical protein